MDMSNPFKQLIGLFLHVANTSPSDVSQRQFYALKDELLKRFGTPDGFDIQHIVRTCYSCDGTGIHMGYYGAESCFRCNDGIYDEALVKLLRFKLGSYTFHIPDGRIESGVLPFPPTIEGYVRHQQYRGYLAAECFYWLALFFKPSLFKATFGHCGHVSRKWTPMVILATWLFDWRMHVRAMDQWHDDPSGRTMFGTCQALEIERLNWSKDGWGEMPF
jgi:hypothetical protein